MKKTLIIFSIIFIAVSCDLPKEETRWIQCDINNLRIDDDSEYHLTYTYPSGYVYSEHDISYLNINIYRKSLSKPIYKILYSRPSPKHDWMEKHADESKIILLPIEYKIETFND